MLRLIFFFANKQALIKYSIQHKLDTAQKMKFSIKDLFIKCDQIFIFRRIW